MERQGDTIFRVTEWQRGGGVARRGERRGVWGMKGLGRGVGVEPPTPRRGAGRGRHATGTVTPPMGDRPGCFAPLFGWAVGNRATGGRACDRDGHATWGVELVAGLEGVVTGARLDGGYRDLPVSRRREEIFSAMRKSRAVVVMEFV